ncbi:MAG: sodium:glutamate symporter [Spirochaetes bacterium]|uniref:Sodium:glutamate symporter n=1 Tax=Candidatus Ornithospirochaeta stercoripullorum TaxID=2840899 RepID=A0A9D9DWH3_9SPIO|nr:sodium:glutamate symporter [Candidatus Ornithospirochaeta stercoripullorum]
MNFNAIINLGVVGAGLLLGALLRAKVKLLQRYLIPSAIIGGFFLLFFYNFAAPRIGLEADFLGDLVYHLLNISFIAMALRNPAEDRPKDGSARRSFIQNVIAIFGQYGLQCFFGLLATLVMMKTFIPDLFPAIGLTLPLGFELGPGQAYSITLPWEALGFEGGTSVGLAMAAAGFITGSIGGVILINLGVKRGWVPASDVEKLNQRRLFSGFLKKGETREGSRLTSDGESIDTLSYHVALIMVSYLLSWAMLAIIEKLLGFLGGIGAEISSTLWGVNFIFSMFSAAIVRQIIKRTKIDYTIDNGTLNRINGLSVDLTVAACLGAISLTALSAYYIPVIILIVVGILITCFVLPWYSSRIYSDHQFYRMLVLFGTATGTLPTGLSLLRVVDPDFETPAARDYAYASGMVFVFVFPLILFVNLPAYSYSQNNPALFFTMLGITLIYSVIFAIAYKIAAGKKAFRKLGTFWYKEDK